MLCVAAGRTSGVLREQQPFVLPVKLEDLAVTYELNVYIREPLVCARIYADVHWHIPDVFNEYGVQIMVPAYEADPDEPKVVPREQWYAAPASSDQRRKVESGDDGRAQPCTGTRTQS